MDSRTDEQTNLVIDPVIPSSCTNDSQGKNWPSRYRWTDEFKITQKETSCIRTKVSFDIKWGQYESNKGN